MIEDKKQFLVDDIYLLGNIASHAITLGFGDEALKILKFLQIARSKNAGAFMMEAMHMAAIGNITGAIQFLEDSAVFGADTNRDEAIAFHLLLLQENSQNDRALKLGEAYLAENLLMTDTARNTVERLVSELRKSELEVSAVHL